MIMTRDKAFKVAVRQRMAQTGEPYSVAKRLVTDEDMKPGTGQGQSGPDEAEPQLAGPADLTAELASDVAAGSDADVTADSDADVTAESAPDVTAASMAAAMAEPLADSHAGPMAELASQEEAAAQTERHAGKIRSAASAPPVPPVSSVPPVPPVPSVPPVHEAGPVPPFPPCRRSTA